jgi:hypothetical protein
MINQYNTMAEPSGSAYFYINYKESDKNVKTSLHLQRRAKESYILY